MIITLPWPDDNLFQNESQRRGGQFLRRQAAREYKEKAYCEVNNLVVDNPEFEPKRDIIAITMDFYPPDDRRDFINCQAAMKPAIDGIFKRLKRNDKTIREEYSRGHDPDPNNPRVVISLIEKDER